MRRWVQASAALASVIISSGGAPPAVREPRRWVLLQGPHDRFNFGDLLFEKVVSRLLVEKAGYLPEELVSVGMISVNMSQFGGHPNVISAKRAVALSHAVSRLGNKAGPFDIVYLGGESTGCTSAFGASMFPSEDQREEALAESMSPTCAYLLPKSRLVPPEYTGMPQPVSVVNSVGVPRRKGCDEALEQADYLGFRNLMPNARLAGYPRAQSRPDSAVMVDKLFRSVITEYAELGEVATVRMQTAGKYIAVQMKHKAFPAATVARALDEVWTHTNLTTVFFRAGSVPNHDSLEYYEAISALMKGPYIIFETEHVWSIVALISRATGVLSTSLHVRIMAFVHGRPRVTVCTQPKHSQFIQIWEAPDATSCLQGQSLPLLWPTLGRSLHTSQERTLQAGQRAADAYLASFDEWSSLLNRRQ